MSRIFIFIFACLLQLSLQKSTPQDDHYIAAVVEYEIQFDVDLNLKNYLRLIKEASEQNVDIMIFPELMLTLERRSVNVPMFGSLKDYPVPADRPDLYDEILVNLSQAAKQHQIYVVVNLQEIVDCNDAPGEYCPEKNVYKFNTNVVFDRNGTVIDRYRKINLFNEPMHYPALKPDLGVFSTDFGVTFGHYICFDIMFQVPAIQVVEKHNLTDILYSTMWFSEMPYLIATQTQAAYAHAMNVNLIASGANNVRYGTAGSGIYSGKAGALVSIMPGMPTTRMLVAKVPKVPGKVTEKYPGPIYDNPSDQDNLYLMQDPSLLAHINKPLVPGFQEITLVDKDLSCKFRVNLKQSSEKNYQYRAVAFSGVRTTYGEVTGGNRICAVIACTGDTIYTCGTRFSKYEKSKTGVFEELSIVATVPTPEIVADVGAHDSFYFPATLTTTIMPLESKDYQYAITHHGNVTNLSLVLQNKAAELFTFAIWGRDYTRDGEVASPPLTGSSHTILISSALIIVALFFVFVKFRHRSSFMNCLNKMYTKVSNDRDVHREEVTDQRKIK